MRQLKMLGLEDEQEIPPPKEAFPFRMVTPLSAELGSSPLSK